MVVQAEVHVYEEDDHVVEQVIEPVVEAVAVNKVNTTLN